MSIISKILSTGASKLINSVSDVVDKFVTTDAEREELKMDLIGLINEDKNAAREMYKHDNILQKIFAIVFLVGYITVSVFLIYLLFSATVLTATQSTFITMIFTAMSMKVNTIVDFLFGGSLSTKKNEEN